MHQHDIDLHVLDDLSRIKIGVGWAGFNNYPIMKREMRLRFLRTFIRYHHVLSPDFLVKITKKLGKWIAEMHEFSIVLGDHKTMLEVERLVSQLPNFIERLPNLEYLQLTDLHFIQSKKWCLGVAFHNLKFLKRAWLDISEWDASEDSFPQLETLVIKGSQAGEDVSEFYNYFDNCCKSTFSLAKCHPSYIVTGLLIGIGTSKVVVMKPGGHGFKLWKQPLAKMQGKAAYNALL
ncbi:hypothetical protein FXO38_00993 [Capsicum annuum]|nr:hypothetical protein FXO38_00993 [Capsicum annuum]